MAAVQDIFNLQDTDPDGYPRGENPQHVYTVRSSVRDLWGDQASALRFGVRRSVRPLS
jgi:Nitrile hydratase beta subunit